jgi:putative endonuclease
MPKTGFVYILSNKYRLALYTGVTSDLMGRVWKHKTGAIKGHASKYKITELVYYEVHGSMYEAISREKKLKGSSRLRKMKLITEFNPNGETCTTNCKGPRSDCFAASGKPRLAMTLLWGSAIKLAVLAFHRKSRLLVIAKSASDEAITLSPRPE